MATQRPVNFYSGPSALPLEVMEKAREELLDLRGSGLSVMETSHRSKEYDAVHNEAIAAIRRLMGLGDDFSVLFMYNAVGSEEIERLVGFMEEFSARNR